MNKRFKVVFIGQLLRSWRAHLGEAQGERHRYRSVRMFSARRERTGNTTGRSKQDPGHPSTSTPNEHWIFLAIPSSHPRMHTISCLGPETSTHAISNLQIKGAPNEKLF